MSMISFGDIESVVLFGAGEVLVEAVEYAREIGWNTAVVTAPRQKTTIVEGESMVERLRSMDVKTIISENLEEDSVRSLFGPDTLGLSFGAAWIFDEQDIDALDRQLVNFHGSRLPQDRGGGGFSWRILRGDSVGYSQAHLISSGIDTGDVLLTNEYRFPDECTTPADYAAVANKNESKIVRRLLEGIAEGRNFETVSQPEYLSSYWPRLSTEEHGYIDWDWSLEEIVQFTRAFSDPYEGAKTFVKGEEVRMKQCASLHGDGTFHPFQSGILYRKNDERGYVATPQGTLIVGELLNENGDSFLSEVKLGDRFYTPKERLDQAQRTRVRFTPEGMYQEEY